jgi:enoyl-CoA hydratase
MEAMLDNLEGTVATRDLGAVRLVVFNRAEKRNALSAEMRRAFAHALREANEDASINAVIVTGTGGVFSAGIDISELRSVDMLPPVRPNPGEAARSFSKPLIAAVDGACITGGLEIALSCSFIIASDRAKFADTHARVGGFPSWGLSALLPRAVGLRRSRYMALTGAVIDAQTALAWGLVNEITHPVDLLPRCLEIAKTGEGCNPESLRRQFGLLDRNEGESLVVALANERQESDRWIAHLAERRLSAKESDATRDPKTDSH